MKCSNCGAEMQGQANCPSCGAPANTAPVNTGDSPAKILVFGIVGLALSSGIIGLIFSILGLVKANRYIAQNGRISKQVNIGRGLSVAGIIIAIVCDVLCIFAGIIIAANWDAIMEYVRTHPNINIRVTM